MTLGGQIHDKVNLGQHQRQLGQTARRNRTEYMDLTVIQSRTSTTIMTMDKVNRIYTTGPAPQMGAHQLLTTDLQGARPSSEIGNIDEMPKV
jgi:hypothetical protein